MVGVLEVCSIGSWEMVGSSRADQQRDDSRNGPSTVAITAVQVQGKAFYVGMAGCPPLIQQYGTR